MIDKQTVFEIHRLHQLSWSHRKIARTLGIDRDTVKNYVNDPQRKFNRSVLRSSKLDPFRQLIQKWLNDVANVRIHHTTGQRPVDRFEKVRLNPLPELLPDCRQVLSLKVHKDFAVRFDTNSYTVPPWTIGQKLTVKADAATVSVYHKHKKVACHMRCWQRKQRIESPTHTQQVKRIRKRLWQDRQIAALASVGLEARYYLKAIIDANLPIKKNVTKLLSLNDQYGTTMLIWAMRKALSFNAYGAEYIENILYQNRSPKKKHPPVRLKDAQLNTITLTQPCLADYDAHILKKDKKNHD